MNEVPKAIGAKFKYPTPILPKSTTTVDFGSTTFRWATGFFESLDISVNIVVAASGGIVIGDDGSIVIGENGNISLDAGSNILVGTGANLIEIDSVSNEIRIGGNKVLTTRQSNIGAPSGGATIDSQARTAIGLIIARLQAHGLIS